MRVYQKGIINFNGDFGQFLLESIFNEGKDLAKTDEELSSKFLMNHMDRFRKVDGIPNKILAIIKRDDDRWCLITFDHEPVNESFEIKADEDNNLYIELKE